MYKLPMGGNATLISARFELTVDWSAHNGVLDVSAYILGADGKVRSDADMIFYNQPLDESGALRISKIGAGATSFSFDVDAAPDTIDRIVICATVEEPGKTMAAFQGVRAQVFTNGEAVVGFCPVLDRAAEVAMQLVEVYRRNGTWKIRAIGQGFNAGLGALARSFGIDVAEDEARAPEPAARAMQSERIADGAAPRESVIALREEIAVKTKPTTVPASSLAATRRLVSNNERHELRLSPPASLGILTSRLSWVDEFGSVPWRARPLELALGILYKLKDGRDGVVQLCDFAGALDKAPYIQVLPDIAEAGNRVLGMRVNADHAFELSHCVIFAYISRGAANWRASAMEFSIGGSEQVVIDIPDGGDGLATLALARIDFLADSLAITRLAKHYQSHCLLAEDLGWNLKWRDIHVG